MAGIPPLVGFFSKLLVLISLIKSDYIFATIIIVIFSGIACFYYIRLIKTFFFNKNKKNYFWVSKKKTALNIILSVTFFFNILFFFTPNVLSTFCSVISFSFF
jgi:NADH-quinone oxidoreductase subunit N